MTVRSKPSDDRLVIPRKRGDLKRIILWNQHVIEKLLREYVQGSNFWILGTCLLSLHGNQNSSKDYVIRNPDQIGDENIREEMPSGSQEYG